MKNSTDLQTLPELSNYLKACIALEETTTWPEIGARIMCIIGNDHYDEWYESYPTFQALFELACKIEAWPAYGLRKSDCRELKKLVNQFAQEINEYT